MVTEAKIERYKLKKEYPGINPTLADRALTSAGGMGERGIMEVGRNFQNHVGFKLLLNAYLLRRNSNDELAEFALETAERMVPSLFGKERKLAEKDLLMVAPGRHRETERSEDESAVFQREDAPAKTPAFWHLVETYDKMKGTQNEREAYLMLQRAVLLLNRVESNEAQRTISEIENRIQPENAALVLLEIMGKETRSEITNKATAHFEDCIQNIDPKAVGIVADLKDVLEEASALEALNLLVTQGKEAAQIRIIECYPFIGVNYALSFLDCRQEHARAQIEVVKDIASETGVYHAIPRLMAQLNLESREAANLNLAIAVIEALNECDYAVLEGVVEGLGLMATERAVGLLEFIAEQGQVKPHVQEAAVRALRLTGQSSALDVAERFLENDETGVRAAAYHALGKLAFLNEPLVESIFCIGAENNEEDPRIRMELIHWLEKNGGKIGLTALQRIMSREGTEDRLEAAAAKAVETLSEKSRRRSLHILSISDKRPSVSIPPMKKISKPPQRRS